MDTNVLAHVLHDWLNSDQSRSIVARADAAIDQAIHVVQHEEPTLHELLSGDETLAEVFAATMAAIQHEIVDDRALGYPLAVTTQTISVLISRAFFPVATAVVTRERLRQLEERRP